MKKKQDEKLIDTHGLAGLYTLVDPAMAKKVQLKKELIKTYMTGQLMVMEQNETPDKSRVIFSMFGVVAVPKGLLIDMHQYPIAGIPKEEHIDIIFDTTKPIDQGRLRGCGMAAIITSGIWRI